MYCKQCGIYFSGHGDKCPSCKATEQASNQTSSSRTQVDWKRLGIILCILLLTPFGIHLYNNSGGYDIVHHSADYSRIEYRGSLNKLVNDDCSLLDDFLDGEVDGKHNVRAIYCSDYTLEWCGYGQGGTVDLLEYNITFFEKGLREYNENNYRGDYFDRFREDFMFLIEKKSNSHEYYFQNLSDVSEWLKQNF